MIRVVGFAKSDARGRQRGRKIGVDMILPGHTLADAIRAGDDRDDRQAVFDGEGKVARIVGWHGHDRAGAVGHQDIVGNPDRDALAVDRVRGKAAAEDAGFFFVSRQALDVALAPRLRAIGLHRRSLRRGRQFFDQRMFRRQHHERCAPQRIGPRGEHLDREDLIGDAAGRLEGDARAFAAADPVGLQHLHPFRPRHAAEIQQLFGVVCDLEEPLVQFLLDDRRAAALAVAIFTPNLLARQGGVALRAEVHGRERAIGQPCFVQTQKEPLGPFVVIRVTRDRLMIPGKHGGHRTQLFAHVLDV